MLVKVATGGGSLALRNIVEIRLNQSSSTLGRRKHDVDVWLCESNKNVETPFNCFENSNIMSVILKNNVGERMDLCMHIHWGHLI